MSFRSKLNPHAIAIRIHEQRYLHQPIELCSCRVVLTLCNVFYTDAACSLAIDRDRLQVDRCQFRYCHLPIPFVCVWCEHIGFVLCGNHKYICDEPVNGLFVNFWSFNVHWRALTCGSIFSFRRLVVTVFCIRLLYDALPAAFLHRSLSSIKQHI